MVRSISLTFGLASPLSSLPSITHIQSEMVHIGLRSTHEAHIFSACVPFEWHLDEGGLNVIGTSSQLSGFYLSKRPSSSKRRTGFSTVPPNLHGVDCSASPPSLRAPNAQRMLAKTDRKLGSLFFSPSPSPPSFRLSLPPLVHSRSLRFISLYLSLLPPPSLSLILSPSLSFSLSLSLPLVLFVFALCLSVSLSLHLSLSVSVSLCRCVSVSMSVCISLFLSVPVFHSLYLSLPLSLFSFSRSLSSLSLSHTHTNTHTHFLSLCLYLSLSLSFSLSRSLFRSLSLALSLSRSLSLSVSLCLSLSLSLSLSL